MTEAELIKNCEADNIRYAPGEHGGKKGFFLHWEDPARLDAGECVFLDGDSLPEQSWPTVNRFVKAGRDVHHMSRIVGYYSRIQNWNPSKRGELKDRHKGRYGLEGDK